MRLCSCPKVAPHFLREENARLSWRARCVGQREPGRILKRRLPVRWILLPSLSARPHFLFFVWCRRARMSHTLCRLRLYRSVSVCIALQTPDRNNLGRGLWSTAP